MAKRLIDKEVMNVNFQAQPDPGGHFGRYGGRYAPETLMHPLEELEAAYLKACSDPVFQQELEHLLSRYAGRPTPLTLASRLSDHLGGARIYLKREDLLHTGAHKINNCLGQALLARPRPRWKPKPLARSSLPAA